MPAMVDVMLVVLAHAILAWLVTYMLHSTILYGIACAAEKVRDDAEWRSIVWRTAIFAPLFTASLHTWLPFGSPFRVSVEPVSAVLGPHPLIGVAIIGVSMSLVVWRTIVFLRSEIRARTALRMRRPCTDPRLHRMLAAEAGHAGLANTPRLTTSTASFSPAALVPAEVCVPGPIFDALPHTQQRALLAHEVAHIARRDPLWCGAALAVARVCCFQPLNRASFRRLRSASEHAADERALRAGSHPLDLAGALAALAPYAMRGAHARTAATGAPIVDRVARILDTRARRRPVSALQLTFAVVLLAGTCLTLGPGVNFTPENAANSIPWLAPSKEEPNVRMLEVRTVDRRVRDRIRRM